MKNLVRKVKEFFNISITTSYTGHQYNFNNKGSSYDENGTYQYYWNEKGEYVKEYLGGVNNSKL